jgi:hypothetical protein
VRKIVVMIANSSWAYMGKLCSVQNVFVKLFAGKWMELKNIILREISQVQKAKVHIFPHMWNIDQIQIQAIL